MLGCASVLSLHCTISCALTHILMTRHTNRSEKQKVLPSRERSSISSNDSSGEDLLTGQAESSTVSYRNRTASTSSDNDNWTGQTEYEPKRQSTLDLPQEENPSVTRTSNALVVRPLQQTDIRPVSLSSLLSTDSSNDTVLISSVVVSIEDAPLAVKIPPVVLSDGWVFAEEIGCGGFAKVYKVTNRRRFPNQVMACKMLDLGRVNSEWVRKHLALEMKITQSMSHPNIMSAVHVMKTTHHGFIFMHWAVNGTIADYMFKVKKRPLKENLARLWLHQLMAGLHYLHGVNIVHRDLKLDNFLLDQTHRALITDFGLAVRKNTSSSMVSNFFSWMFPTENSILCETQCGTPEYMAPEVHQLVEGGRYSARPVDMYAMGVCLFEMVNLVKPFRGGPYWMRSRALIHLQLTCQFAYNPRVTLSRQCREVIGSLLNPNARSRPTAGDMLKNKWLCQ